MAPLINSKVKWPYQLRVDFGIQPGISDEVDDPSLSFLWRHVEFVCQHTDQTIGTHKSHVQHKAHKGGRSSEKWWLVPRTQWYDGHASELYQFPFVLAEANVQSNWKITNSINQKAQPKCCGHMVKLLFPSWRMHILLKAALVCSMFGEDSKAFCPICTLFSHSLRKHNLRFVFRRLYKTCGLWRKSKLKQKRIIAKRVVGPACPTAHFNQGMLWLLFSKTHNCTIKQCMEWH